MCRVPPTDRQIDDLDRRLLAVLASDGRSTMADLGRRVGLSRTAALARVQRLEREGVIRLQAEPEAVASILFALADGFGIQVLSDPEWDQGAAFELGVGTARRLLGAPS